MVDSHLVEDEDEVELGPVEVMLDEEVVVVDSLEMEAVDTEEVEVVTEVVVEDLEVVVDSVVVEEVDSLPQLQAVPPGGRRYE
jgi:hypothetical protein